MTNRLKYISYGIISFSLAMPITGCLGPIDGDFSINQRDKIKAHNKLKQEWESQKLEGRVLEFTNRDGSKDFKYPVRDVILNYNGWSILYTDVNSKEIIEQRFNDHYSNTKIKVFEDLELNQERYAEVRNYKITCWEGLKYDVIIHLRKNDRILSGDDSTGGKHPIHHKRSVLEMNDPK